MWKGRFRVFKYLTVVDYVAVSAFSNWYSALVSKQWPEVFEGSLVLSWKAVEDLAVVISLISDLKKKNPHWDRKSVDDQDLTARALFTEENTDGEIWFIWQFT